MNPSSLAHADRTQVEALALLVEAEARWENLPLADVRDKAVSARQTLLNKQKAFDAYRTHLTAYIGRYGRTPDAEWSTSTPVRLAAWCRRMRDVFRQVLPTSGCPIHLMEKAYRRADHIATRLGRKPVGRTTPLADLQDAIGDLATVAEWCDGLVAAKGGDWKPQVSPT